MKKAFEVWAMLLLFFSASGATIASRSIYTLEAPFLPSLMLVTCIAMLSIGGLRVRTSLVYALIFFFIYFVLQSMKFESLHLKFLFLIPLCFIIAYSYVAYFEWGFFKLFNLYLSVLAAISVIFWIAHIVAPTLLVSTCDTFSKLRPYNDIIVSHCFIYTVVDESVDSFTLRNSGFAWEPGAFAVFLCLGIASNLLTKAFSFRSNYGLWMQVVALLSTQSTTGYIFLVVLATWAAWNRFNHRSLLLATPIAALAFLAVFSLPFMGEKITVLLEEDIDSLLYTASLDWNQSKQLTAQRFVSFKIDWLDFLDNPILGYGGHDEAMWLRSTAPNVAAISGLGKLFAKFGVVGISFFTIVSLSSARLLVKHFKVKGAYFFLLFYLVIATSYSLLETPFLMCLWFAPYVALRPTSRSNSV